jgi:hypothetical protein
MLSNASAGKEDAMRRNPDQDHWHDAFDLCANSLAWLAGKLDPIWPGGMDYVKINVIGFCFILPLILAASLGLNLAFLLGWL